MKKEKISLEISNPCQKLWKEMIPNQTGRFCVHCQTDIIDFTDMSDDEIMQILSATTEKVCGRFKSSQIDREFELTGIKSARPRFTKVMAALAASLALASPTAMAQSEKQQVETTDIKQNEVPQANCIKGTIVEKATGDGMIGVTVRIEGTTTGTNADIDGKFAFIVPDDLLKKDSTTLAFSYIGCIRQTLQVKTNELPMTLTIKLEDDPDPDYINIFVLGMGVIRKVPLDENIKPLPTLMENEKKKK